MAVNKVGAKRSLFNKPAWASTSTRTVDDDTPIFGQAQHYSEIVESKRVRKEKAVAKQLERARTERQQEQEQESKRRRISKDGEGSDDDSNDEARSNRSETIGSQRSQKSVTPVHKEEHSKASSPPQKQHKRLIDKLDSVPSPRTRSRKARDTARREVVVLDLDGEDENDKDETSAQIDKEDDDLYSAPKSRRKKTQPQSEEESEEEDDYLRELKAKAREEARSKKLGIGVGKEHTPGSPTTQSSADGRSPDAMDSKSPSKHLDLRASRATSTPAGDDEAEVKIWINTIIPGAKDIIVNRKISQPLDKVKEFWIKRNELEPSIAERVFFTWNGTRLYNSTTMRGIIERLKKTHPTKDGSDPSNGKITIEAVTDEIFEYRQKQRARKLAEAEAGTSIGDEDRPDSQITAGNDTAADGDGTPVPQAQNPVGIIIKLKAQGHEEMKLRVRPDTLISKILNGFCKLRNVDPGLQRWLSYDGDKLEEDATVEEVGFEHEDTVEVYLR